MSIFSIFQKNTTEKNIFSVDKITIDNKIVRLELEAVKILSMIKEYEKKNKDKIEFKINELTKENLNLSKQIQELSSHVEKLNAEK